jgi:phospholipid N-methyltransferase
MNTPATNIEHVTDNPQSGVPPEPPEAFQQAGAGDENTIAMAQEAVFEGQTANGMTATYSPEDNKLRLFSVHRLDPETYKRVNAAGFRWAPKQRLFVAPMWTPARADLLIALCGEIGDEDTSLVERAEERADRFSEYRAKRADDANRAHDAVHRIADHIPMGQPIMIGHHSERRARKDQERIQNGMHQAVKMWETSQYWKDRAAGAIAHAKYKELPEVRYRRIKGLESDLRKQVKAKDEAEALIRLWDKATLTLERAQFIADRMGYHSFKFPLDRYPRQLPASQDEGPMSIGRAIETGVITPDQAADLVFPWQRRVIAWADRWITHYTNRLAYERAMLGEAGGIKADAFDLRPGGRVLVRGTWSTIVRLNKKGGQVVSVTTNSRFVPVRGLEEIDDYQAPTEEAAAKATAATKLAPLCNYNHENFVKMTKAEWERIHKDYKATRTIGKGAPGDRYDRFDKSPYEMYGPHRVRSCIASAATGQRLNGGLVLVYITDMKATQPPMPHEVPPVPEKLEPPARAVEASRSAPPTAPEEASKFDAMKRTLRAGISVVAAPQLFPTPMDLARRMVDEAGICDGDRVGEFHAGTGNLVRALRESGKAMHIVMVEINRQLCEGLNQFATARTPEQPQSGEVICADFLTLKPGAGESGCIGLFDAIVINPPFENAVDIKHITHARRFLKPGGRMVAICAGGPRQHDQLRPLVERLGGWWEPLEAGTFQNAGTNVHTVLLFLAAPEDVAATA